jgi:hypothetical protein
MYVERERKGGKPWHQSNVQNAVMRFPIERRVVQNVLTQLLELMRSMYYIPYIPHGHKSWWH